MSHLLRLPVGRCVAALLLLGATAGLARAQYGYGYGNYAPRGVYPNGIYGPGYGYGTGYGNYLQGTSTVMDAYGNLGLQQEQAGILRQKAEQEKLVTKRKTFDEMRYEQENTPSYAEKLEGTQALKIRRVLNNPKDHEVTNGSAFNTLMPFLNSLAQKEQYGHPTVMLDPDVLKQINVSAGTSDVAKESSGAGVLKDGGRVSWPFALRGSMQEELDPLLVKAVDLASQNKMTPKLYKQITQQVSEMTEDLRKQFHKEDIDSSAFLEGKHFLDNLGSSITLLKSPNAAKYFNGTYCAKGATVEELVVNMTKNGLKFAAARPGDEPAYFALLNSFQTYASYTEAGELNFRLLTVAAQPTGPPKKKTKGF